MKMRGSSVGKAWRGLDCPQSLNAVSAFDCDTWIVHWITACCFCSETCQSLQAHKALSLDDLRLRRLVVGTQPSSDTLSALLICTRYWMETLQQRISFLIILDYFRPSLNAFHNPNASLCASPKAPQSGYQKAPRIRYPSKYPAPVSSQLHSQAPAAVPDSQYSARRYDNLALH